MCMLLRKMREHNKRRKDELKEPSLKLENDTKESTGDTSEPADPTRRWESLVPHAGESKTTEVSPTPSMTHTSKPDTLKRSNQMRSNLFNCLFYLIG